MKRKFDLFSFLAIIFTLWYSITAIVYILEYYFDIKLVSLVGEAVAYPIMVIATLGGLFVGGAQAILIAWSAIIAVAIGVIGWISRGKNGLYFLILPCVCLAAPLLMFALQSTSAFPILMYAMPVISLIALCGWTITEIIMVSKKQKA